MHLTSSFVVALLFSKHHAHKLMRSIFVMTKPSIGDARPSISMQGLAEGDDAFLAAATIVLFVRNQFLAMPINCWSRSNLLQTQLSITMSAVIFTSTLTFAAAPAILAPAFRLSMTPS
jgi:hypothetical protein